MEEKVRSRNVEVLLRKGSRLNDLIRVVRFKEASNFDVRKLEWVPTFEELDTLVKVRQELLGKVKAEGKEVAGMVV